ncbi:3-oxoadipate enol-lactonase [Oryzibacter oryziterrae]|uniref:3-oxoadipate enol-lactonase n=1 Tax=Oryzibacter oryziterrae TaxID=2766474 RepID=UPI001F018E8D|nr:3-oxoadipate enol-lactonase [Oryzibacter oryziterrae]
MPFIPVGDLNVHYRLTGPADAPVIVFINALGTDFRIWDDVVAAIGNRARILTYDKRGHGLTTASPGDYSGTLLADDLIGLLDALSIERASLVGQSVGGLIAQVAATHAPQRVTKLVLSNTAAVFGTPQTWTDRAATVRASGTAPLVDATMERWFSPAFHATNPADVAGAATMLARTDRIGYAGTCAALRDADLRDNATRITRPTLVIGGQHDGSTPPAVVAALAAAVPGARLEMLETAHLPCIERPAEHAALIAGHLLG